MAALERKLANLKREMNSRFREVDARFAQVDARFAQVDAQFVQVRKEILEEGERTRRYFDVVAEHIHDQIVMVLDKVQANDDQLARLSVQVGRVLDNHEARLQDLERH